MKKHLWVIVLCSTILIVSIGFFSGLVRRVLADVTCASTTVLTQGQLVNRTTTGGTVCFRTSVAAGTPVLTLALKAVSGNFDLYVARGANVSPLRDAAHKFNLSAISPDSPSSTFVLQQPQAGTYTIGIAPRSSGNSSFNFKTSGAPVSSAQSSGSSCTGNICSGSYPLTMVFDASIGSDFGARAIFPIEVLCPGQIRAWASWSGSAQTMALILNGPGQVGYFDRKDGRSPLAVSSPVSTANIQQGRRWWVSLVNFSGGTANGSVTIDYPDPNSCVVNDSISNMVVTSATDTEVTFTVNYNYNGARGDNIGLGVYALQNGQKLPWFGYRPDRVYQGGGTATVTLVLLTDRSDLPPNFTTDQVQFEMYVGGGSEFLTQRYNYVKYWVTGVPEPPTVTPVLSLRDELLASIRSSRVPNDYPQQAEQFVDSLLFLLGDVPHHRDVGDRINGIVGRIWGDWSGRARERGFDLYRAEPGNYGFSPFRQLVIRMVQGRQGELSGSQRRALHSFLTRNEDARTWSENPDGVIGAINREYFN